MEKSRRIETQNPKWKDRDRFVLSKGHAAPTLAKKGFFPLAELCRLRQIGWML